MNRNAAYETAKKLGCFETSISTIYHTWGEDPGDWGLMGPPLSDDDEKRRECEETVRFRYIAERDVWKLERRSEDGEWYVALDDEYHQDDVIDLAHAEVDNYGLI